MADSNPKLEAVPSERKHQKTESEKQIERLASMTPVQLGFEDLSILERLRNQRAAILETTNEMVELRARLKARKNALDTLLLEASAHYDNRRLAESFTSK